jgi:hypothetical protein
MALTIFQTPRHNPVVEVEGLYDCCYWVKLLYHTTSWGKRDISAAQGGEGACHKRRGHITGLQRHACSIVRGPGLLPMYTFIAIIHPPVLGHTCVEQHPNMKQLGWCYRRIAIEAEGVNTRTGATRALRPSMPTACSAVYMHGSARLDRNHVQRAGTAAPVHAVNEQPATVGGTQHVRARQTAACHPA